MHSTISSDFISAQCVQSIHTDHNLWPWSAQWKRSTHPHSAVTDIHSWQRFVGPLNGPYLPTFSGPCPTFGYTWSSLVKSLAKATGWSWASLTLSFPRLEYTICFPSFYPCTQENFFEWVGIRVAVHSSWTVKQPYIQMGLSSWKWYPGESSRQNGSQVHCFV